jgi:hypothetical protein
MKKAYFVIPALIVIFSTSVLFGTIRKTRVERENQEKQVLSAQNDIKKNIAYTINFGETKIETTTPYEENLTVYNALENITTEKKILIEAKKYNFGVMVNKIDNIGGEKTKGWVFFVNGKLGDKSADTTPLNPGDTIEWKYQSF